MKKCILAVAVFLQQNAFREDEMKNTWLSATKNQKNNIRLPPPTPFPMNREGGDMTFLCQLVPSLFIGRGKWGGSPVFLLYLGVS